MTALVGRRSWLRRPDVLVGAVVSVVVLGVTFNDPRSGGLMLVIGVAALIVGVIALRNPLVAMLLLLLVTFGAEVVKSVPGDPFLLSVYAVAISSVLALHRGEHRAPRLGIPELLMALYVLWNVGSMVMAHEIPGGDGTWKFIVKGAVIPLLVYMVGRFLFDTERSIRWLLWLVAALTVYSTINAIAQIHGPKFLVYPKVTITETGWVDRAVGVFNQPVVNGVMLVVGFLVLFYLSSDDRYPRWLRVAFIAAAAGAAYGVQLTATRSALAALAAVIVLGALLARGWRRMFVATLLLGVAGVAANFSTLVSSDRGSGGLGSSYEIVDRLNIAATALRAIGENPLFGVGINRFAAYNTDHHIAWSADLPWENGIGNVAHETELGIAAETGLPGLALWLAVVVAIAIALVKAFRRLPENEMLGRRFALIGICCLVIWQLNAVFVDMRLLDFANILPFLFMGVTVGLAERYVRDGVLPGRADPPPPAGGQSVVAGRPTPPGPPPVVPGPPGPRPPGLLPPRTPEPAP